MEVLREFLDDGRIASEYELAGGVKNGWARIWSLTGAQIFEGFYVDGILNGAVLEWAENGTLIRRTTKASGVYHGPYESWWDNGQRKELGVFDRGVREKGYQWFGQDGVLRNTF